MTKLPIPTDRESRRAAALRDNLHRRKAARARPPAATTFETGSDASGPAPPAPVSTGDPDV